MGPKRNWDDARAKVEREGWCRVCGIGRGLQAAHVTGRKHDKPKPGQKTRYVHPDSIIPLCPPCHEEYDAKQLDILQATFLPEQLRAVEDLGGIEPARRRLCPSAYTREGIAKEVEAA